MIFSRKAVWGKTSIFFLAVALLVAPIGRASAAGAETILKNGAVLAVDTTWKGLIDITGVVLVSRKATLTIAPGTVIRFHKVDSNSDGIGDGEIRVLGRIISRGTQESPIRFESAEENPSARDWSYLLIFSSHARNELSHCRFRHGFTGLQIHFSTARVTHCLFEDNHEGIRFGRAHLLLQNNLIARNEIGIRFTRMEGPVEISANRITKNRIGVLLVPSGQNIIDFFEPDRSGEPWNTGRLSIKGNDIFANEWYNINLGEKQIWDLDARKNWWGSRDPDQIMDTIYDKRRDPSLGRVLIAPFADSPMEGAGIRKDEATSD